MSLEEVAERRSAGKIGLRALDTSVMIANPYCVPLLSGNLGLIEDVVSSIKKSKFADKLNKFKKPHDLLIPGTVMWELDHVKDKNRKDHALRAQINQTFQSLDHLLILCEGQMDDYESYIEDDSFEDTLRRGDFFYTLPNGARLYMPDLTPKKVQAIQSKRIHPLTNDEMIIYTIKDFVESNPNYKSVRFITNDGGAAVLSRRMGIVPENLRYKNVKNPLQTYTGIYKVTVTGNGRRLARTRKRVNLDVDKFDAEIDLIDPSELLPHQIVEFKKKGADYHDASESQFMISVPGTSELRSLVHYDEFMEFYNSRTYTDEDFELKPVDGRLPYSRQKIGDQEYAKSMLESLVNNKLINEAEHRGIIQELANKRKNKVKGANITKMLKKHFDKFEKRNIAVREEDVKNQEDQKHMILRHRFRDIHPIGHQKPFLDHQLNEDIRCFSFDGKGGFGKTYWSLMAGLYQVHMGKYDRLLYVSSTAYAEAHMGYRPGGKDKKIEDIIAPAKHAIEKMFTPQGKDVVRGGLVVGQYIKDMESSGRIKFDVIENFRGLSLERTYAVFDEGHHFSEDEAALILGRFEADSKVIFLSAMEQFSVGQRMKGPNLSSSGIMHMVDVLSGEDPAYAHMTADPTEIHRGPIAEMAAKLSDKSLMFFR